MIKYIEYRILYFKQLLHLLFDHTSFLKQTGYLKSLKKGIPIDRNSEPTLWMSYSITNFLQKRLTKDISVFEWGSGYSTIYIANLVKRVTSIENNLLWYNKLLETVNGTTNIELLHVPYGQQYVDKIGDVAINKKYELIIVDGFLRVKCAQKAIEYLTDDGVLLLDDSNRERYKEVFKFYKDTGFKELTLSGLKPSNIQLNFTTIFYRANNVLGI